MGSDRWFDDELPLKTLFKPGAPRCHQCGSSAPEGPPDSYARCAVCGCHLHTCFNCMFFDGLACLILETAFQGDSAIRGKFCPSFIWRED